VDLRGPTSKGRARRKEWREEQGRETGGNGEGVSSPQT